MRTLTTPRMEQDTKTSAEPELRLVLPNRAENVALVRRALSGVVDVLELGEARLLDINAAVSEACNNVVVHAYEGAEGPMDVYLCIQPTELEVIVSDHGVGIRPNVPEPGRRGSGPRAVADPGADRPRRVPWRHGRGHEGPDGLRLRGRLRGAVRRRSRGQARGPSTPRRAVDHRLVGSPGGTGAGPRDRDARGASGVLAGGHLGGGAGHRRRGGARADGRSSATGSSSGSIVRTGSSSSGSGPSRKAGPRGSSRPRRWRTCRRCSSGSRSITGWRAPATGSCSASFSALAERGGVRRPPRPGRPRSPSADRAG